MDKARCPSCTAEYFATEFECPACGERNPTFAKPAASEPLPSREAPAERSSPWGWVGLVVLVLACAVGGAVLLRGDLALERKNEDLLAELAGAFHGVSFTTVVGETELEPLVVRGLKLQEPVDPSRPMPFEGYLDSSTTRVGHLTGTWDRSRKVIQYNFRYSVQAAGGVRTVSGDREMHLQTTAPPSPGSARGR